MADEPVVIYTARSAAQAQLLRNLLEEAGIEASVSGGVLADGAGVDAVGWATAARVVVADRDAEVARRYAEEFDRQTGDGGPLAEMEAASGQDDVLTEWPTCPQCDARRTTTCPICHTSGNEFPEADPNFIGSLEPDDGAEPMSSCGCGSGGCSTGGDASCGATADEPAAEEATDEASPTGLVVMCTMCDEPFRPEFARRCALCGHEFPDGYEVDVQQTGPVEEVTTRALAVIIALGLLAMGLIVYFLFLTPGGQ